MKVRIFLPIGEQHQLARPVKEETIATKENTESTTTKALPEGVVVVTMLVLATQ
jgi:hypothetical protein